MSAHVLRLLEHAVSHPDWVDRLGWMLVHSLWQFALVAIVLGIALRFMTRSSSTARYAASLCALASMVLLPRPSWQSFVPILTVLDSDGKPLINQWTREWGFNWYPLNPAVAKVQAFLLQWSPAQ